MHHHPKQLVQGKWSKLDGKEEEGHKNKWNKSDNCTTVDLQLLASQNIQFDGKIQISLLLWLVVSKCGCLSD